MKKYWIDISGKKKCKSIKPMKYRYLKLVLKISKVLPLLLVFNSCYSQKITPEFLNGSWVNATNRENCKFFFAGGNNASGNYTFITDIHLTIN